MKTLRSAFQSAVARTGTVIIPKFTAAACLLLLLLATCPAQGATNAIKWNQPPEPLQPTNIFYGWNQPSVDGIPNLNFQAADDWVCTSMNPVTKVRWWGSFTNYQGTNLPPALAGFWIVFFTDMPGPQFSHPMTQIQSRWYSNFTWRYVGKDYDPRSGTFESCFLFEQDLGATNYWFYQTNGPSGTNIYWLSIMATGFGLNTNFYWGWKTLPHNTNSPAPDVAVTFNWGGPPNYSPIGGWDLAFELISSNAGATFKWEQLPDLTLTGMDVRATTNMGSGVQGHLLADDFLCVSPGYLTNITIWGSWSNDIAPGNGSNVTFTLSIHDDIPAFSPPWFAPYSMPGTNLLWVGTYTNGQFTVSILASNITEGWYTPTNSYLPIGDTKCYQYDFNISTNVAFYQEGTETMPIVYWLDVQALTPGPVPHFGWKTSPNHWNDDAVWVYANESYSGVWTNLTYPIGHPYEGETLDLAFRLNGGTGSGSQLIKWSQPPVLVSDAVPDGNFFNGWNQYSGMVPPPPMFAADDWACTNAKPVTDIHWWGSFIGWSETNPPPIIPDEFAILIWEDVPAGGGTGYSYPSNVVWTINCSDFTWSFVGWDIDPRDPGAVPEACFKFEQQLNTNDWFYQTNGSGTNIYWLSIAAVYTNVIPETNFWGWKTRPRETNSLAPDDAVTYNPYAMPPQPPWDPIWWPTPADSWDLAFVLTTCPDITLLGSLPDGVVGIPYTNNITVSGGTPPYVAIVNTNLIPPGLKFKPAGTVLTVEGTPITNGVFSFTVSVTDSNGCPAISNYTVTITCPIIKLSPATLPNGAVGTPYTNSITASGGTPSYTYALAGGSGPVPNGLNLTGGGSLEGTPTSNGVFNFTVEATDTYACTGSSNYTVTVATCTTITLSPASLSNAFKGVLYGNVITASGGASPYSYAVTLGSPPGGISVQTNGTVSGTPTNYGVATFTVTATDSNACTGTKQFNLGVTKANDSTPPSVTVKWPPNSTTAVVTNSPLVVTGTASDAGLVTNVEVSLDNGAYATAAGTNDWSLDVGALTPGLHTVKARAQDMSGNEKITPTNTFYYGVAEVLTIVTNDQGNCTLEAKSSTYGTPTNGASLVIGRPYKFTVKPVAGFIYSNTVVSSDAGSSNYTTTKVGFTMQSNTVITVNIPTNRFLVATGTYYGLFSSTNDGVDIKSAGYFRLKVKGKASALPTFSVSVSVDGEKVGGSGSFNLEGEGVLKKPILRKKSGQADLDMSLLLDLGNQQVTGTVTTVSNDWTSDLLGDLATWTLTNPATNYIGTNDVNVGLYTLVVTGAVDSASTNSPGGDGFGTVTLTDTNGMIKMTGFLGDGEKMSQTVGLSKDGDWPFYARMNKDGLGIFKGMIMGWVTVSPGPGRDLSGTLTWVKQAIGTLYPNGFTNTIDLRGSPYDVPADGERPIQLSASDTNGVGRLTLAAEAYLTNAVTVTNITLTPLPLNKFFVPSGATNNPVTLKLKSPLYKTGVVKGEFIHPVSLVKTPIVGVILQDENVALGFFKNSDQSGSFLLEAEP